MSNLDYCLAHLDQARRTEFFAGLEPGTDLDARGVTFNGSIFADLCRAATQRSARSSFGMARFDNSTFRSDVTFSHVEFGGKVSFEGAIFGGDAIFDGPRFGDNSNFGGAKFMGNATFRLTSFEESACFDNVEFRGEATFAYITCGSLVTFDEALFKGRAVFRDLTAEGLGMRRTTFEKLAEIDVATGSLSAEGANFSCGVMLRAWQAVINLEGASLSAASTVLAGEPPLDDRSRKKLTALAAQEARRDGMHVFASYPHDDQMRGPILRSLRGVDVSELTLADVDLRMCLFTGAYHLDQLGIEGRCRFSYPPRGLRLGFAWPPIWRWSRRQILIEEAMWRDSIRKRQPSWRPDWLPGLSGRDYESIGFHGHIKSHPPHIPPPHVLPERAAAVYRGLRKALEDARNEPGAADFYYGEMEMRRHASTTPGAERWLLTFYWLLSGYGLRATRSLGFLAALLALLSIALQRVGFHSYHPPYTDSLLYAGASAFSLELKAVLFTKTLTHWGEAIRILLRLAGPLLIGLSVLAIRGRVKR